MYGPRDFRRKLLAAETNQIMGSVGPQALLDGSSVFLPLTHTAVPARGSIVPSFTRATTETGQKWDEAGYLDFTALAGEIVFKGARRVRNHFTNTENFASADWTKSNGSFSGNVFTASGAGGSFYQTKAATAGTWLVWAKLSCASGTVAAGLFANGADVSPNPTTSTITVTTTPTVFQLAITVTSAGNINAGVSPYNPIAAGSSVTVHEIQLEDVTGQTTQTASKYVSVGVESAPAYHGSMVDGVKCFDTDLNGNPISTSGSYPLVGYVPWEARTNLWLQSNTPTTAPWINTGVATATQNLIGPDGTTSGWTIGDAGALIRDYQINGEVLTAATYTDSYFVAKTVGAQTHYPVMATNSPTRIAVAVIDTTNGVATIQASYTGFTITTSSARCTSHNAAWWRVELTFLADADAVGWAKYWIPAGTTNATTLSGVGNTLDTTASGTNGFYGAQRELGSFATPYIPTTTGAVARDADILTYTGADVANVKTLAATFSRGVGVASIGVIAELHDGTANEDTYMYLTSATNIGFVGRDGGSTVLQSASVITPTNTYVPGTQGKGSVTTGAAAADKRADALGTPVVMQIANTGVGTVTTLGIGQYNNGAFQFNGPVNHIYGWTRNLSQSELGAIDA